MLVKEKLLSGDFFTELAKHGDTPFITVDNTPALNLLLLLECGDRKLFSKLESYDLELITGFIYALHGLNWLRLLELNEVALTGGDTRTITETINSTENRTNTRNELNKVTGFNSDEMLVNDGLEVNAGDDLEGTKVRTLEDKKVNLNTLYSDLSLTQNNSIIKTVLRDITIFLSTSIY